MDEGIADAMQDGFTLAGSLTGRVHLPAPRGTPVRPHGQPITQLHLWPTPGCRQTACQDDSMARTG